MTRKHGDYYRPMSGRRLRLYLWRRLVPGRSAGYSAGGKQNRERPALFTAVLAAAPPFPAWGGRGRLRYLMC